jgi:hypothetical protein
MTVGLPVLMKLLIYQISGIAKNTNPHNTMFLMPFSFLRLISVIKIIINKIIKGIKPECFVEAEKPHIREHKISHFLSSFFI